MIPCVSSACQMMPRESTFVFLSLSAIRATMPSGRLSYGNSEVTFRDASMR